MCEVFEEQLFAEAAIYKTCIMFCLPVHMATLNHIKLSKSNMS